MLFLVLKKYSPTKRAKFSAFKSSKKRSFLNEVPFLVLKKCRHKESAKNSSIYSSINSICLLFLVQNIVNF